MPNIKSAVKRVKINNTKQLQNRMIKSSVRTAIKKFETAVAAGQTQEANALYIDVTSKLDKAVTKGIIHKNTAARNKSRLAVHLQKAQA